ncbi:FG-GAP repeat domain-containing protein [Spirosoma soli]|uniref:FG-GAP repeat domain-containing protein n=1 Tax=Spirosoma soli TaxID=1770529 RepID=A0ABW5LYF5_9BACT
MIVPQRVLTALIFASFLAVFLSSFRRVDPNEGARLAEQYCGSCHVAPNPKSLTKYTWQVNVLPVMASYLGIRYMEYDPYRNLSEDEVALLTTQNIYPTTPVVTDDVWQKIVDYYVENAPTTSRIDSARLQRNHKLSLFNTKYVSLGKTSGAKVTAIAYDTTRHELWVAEPEKLYRWNWTKGLTHNYDLSGTVVDIEVNDGRSLLTEIGTLLPSELAKGSIYALVGDSLNALQTGNHRPVCSLTADLNDDGVEEILTANYGHRSGSLSLYVKQPNQRAYQEQTLLNIPGAVKCYVRDMNKDGRKDIIALFAQNEEAIYIFYQIGDLTFRPEKVLQFEPEYGTSDFVILDYNKDGIDDLAVVHGDNADYSYSLKSFHGLRLLLGGKNQVYTEAFFYPLYGATRVQADDFDQDGDIDFAISAFFPELTRLASESFVYLENTNPPKFRFTPFTLDTPVPVKSLTLEKADVDQDGDLDLLLGQFSFSPVAVPPALQQQWNTVDYKLVVLINRRRP